MKGKKIRVEASHAAAMAFAGQFSNIEELWSLCVFFERYIQHGGDATLNEFGPKEETATVIHLVK